MLLPTEIRGVSRERNYIPQASFKIDEYSYYVINDKWGKLCFMVESVYCH